MALLTVLTEPDPRLHVVAKPVTVVDDEIRRLMADMLETMYKEEGVGLAATQVGVEKRVIVMDVHAGEEEKAPWPLKMANPEILWTSSTCEKAMEGCLSVPEQRGEVTRPDAVKIRYLDENGEPRDLEGDGLLARCIQHEIDHLNGVLYIDHLSTLKRDMIRRKLLRLKRYGE